MNNSAAHSKLVDDILFAVASLSPTLRIFSRKVGLATPPHRTRPIFFGVKGEADMQGFGRFAAPYMAYGPAFVAASFAIEAKTGSGKLTADQRNWRDMFIRLGGFYIEAHSVEEACSGVKSMFML